MIGKPDQDAFIRSMKAAIVTSLRKDGSPTSSLIFYALDGDELLFSTTAERIKAKTLKRDPRIAVAVLDEGAPWRYVTVEGTATVIDERRRARPHQDQPGHARPAGLAAAGRLRRNSSHPGPRCRPGEG